jgi:hypothetical protein
MLAVTGALSPTVDLLDQASCTGLSANTRGFRLQASNLYRVRGILLRL